MPSSDRPLRIAYTCIWYPVAMGRYIHDALVRRPNTEVWSAGPYTGRWIPWKGGMFLPEAYAFKPSFPMPLANVAEVNYNLLQTKVPWEPDVWIEANAGLRAVGRPKQKYVVIGTDPHVLDYTPARKSADLFFSMQRPYMKPGDKWMPYGYDPIWHTPTSKPVRERKYDIALVGLDYANRREAIAIMESKGHATYLQNGPAYGDARDIYHDTKIGLNWSSLQDTTARVFELMAFGIAPLLNRVPDLMQMFQEGRDFEGFSTMQELQDKAEALLANPDHCQALGDQARQSVEPHSWDNRVADLLKECGLS
jgi:glycosyltransferase involved in cell wall biosynthesis